MTVVAAIRAKAHDYHLRGVALDDAAGARGDGQFEKLEHRLAAISFETVAITLYEIAEALEQDGEER